MKRRFLFFNILLFSVLFSCRRENVTVETIFGLKLGAPYFKQVLKVAEEKLKLNPDYDRLTYDVYEEPRYGAVEGNMKFKYAVNEKGDTILFSVDVYYQYGGGIPVDPTFNIPEGYIPLKQNPDFNIYDNLRVEKWGKDHIVKLFEEKYGACKEVVSAEEFNKNSQEKMTITVGTDNYYRWIYNTLQITLSVKKAKPDWPEGRDDEFFYVRCSYEFIEEVANRYLETTKELNLKNNSKI